MAELHYLPISTSGANTSATDELTTAVAEIRAAAEVLCSLSPVDDDAYGDA